MTTAAFIVATSTASVTGFGCRLHGPDHTHHRPAFESRQGNRGLWGTRLSAGYGDLVGADGAALGR